MCIYISFYWSSRPIVSVCIYYSSSDVIQETRATKSSPRKDWLIVEGGPMMRARMKRVKETMRLFVKATIDETIFGMQNETSFILGAKGETNWINLIKRDKEGASKVNYVTAQFNWRAAAGAYIEKKWQRLGLPCGHMTQNLAEIFLFHVFSYFDRILFFLDFYRI